MDYFEYTVQESDDLYFYAETILAELVNDIKIAERAAETTPKELGLTAHEMLVELPREIQEHGKRMKYNTIELIKATQNMIRIGAGDSVLYRYNSVIERAIEILC